MSKIRLEHRSSIYVRDLLKALNAIVDEATLEFDEESVRILSMDPSHVAMIDLELPYSAFGVYEVDEPVKLCLNVGDVLKKVFKKTYKDESVRLEYDPGEEPAAVFTMVTDVERVKKVPALEPDPDPMEIPEPKIRFKSSARLISKTVKTKIIDDMYSEYDHMKIEAGRDAITFSVKGDYGEERVTLDRYNDNVLDLESEEPSRAVYTMPYLQSILKGIVPISPVVNLELSTDMPIKISAELPDGKLAYFLAPCIGAEEDTEKEEPPEVQIRKSEPLVEPKEEEPTEIPAVPQPLTGDQLRHALRTYYLDNPGAIERPPDAVLRQYL